MARTIELDKNDRPIGHFALGYKNGAIGTVVDIVHDGDTITCCWTFSGAFSGYRYSRD